MPLMAPTFLTQEGDALLRPLAGLLPSDRLAIDIDADGTRFNVRLYRELASGRTQASAAAYTFLERTPERKRLDGLYTYQLAGTDLTAVLIYKLWPAEQLFITDGAKTLLDYLYLTWERGTGRAEVFARWRAERAVPIHDLELHPDMPLSLYQQVALVCCYLNEGYALFMEMGTGKTPIVVARFCNEAKLLQQTERRKYRTLVVCPKGVRTNWYEECHKFATQPGVCTVLRGTEVQRVKQLIGTLKAPGVWATVVVSYETMVSFIDVLGDMPWDLAVLDESHMASTPEAKRTKACKRLRDAARQRMVMTGSPIRNTWLDLYSQLEFLRFGGSGFMSWKNFKRFYGVYNLTESGYQQLVGAQNLPFMRERLARYSFSISLKEALPELPDRVYDVHEVEMTEYQADLYRKLQRELAIQIENEMNRADNRQLLINNVLVMLLRLAQITSGFISWDRVVDPNGEVLRDKTIESLSPSPKLLGLEELLADKRPDQKTLVWACFKHDVQAIMGLAERLGLRPVEYYGETSEKDREEAVARFNGDRDCKLLVGNPGAGGVGLNLLGYPPGREDEYTTNCDHTIFYSQDWSQPKRSQAEARGNRRGSRVPMRITDLVVPNSVDEDIRARVTLKRVTALEVTDLRALLARVLNQ